MSLLPWSKGKGRTAGKAEPADPAEISLIQRNTQSSLRTKLRDHLRISSRDPSKRDGSHTPSPVTPSADKDFDGKSAISQKTTIQPDQDLWGKAFRAVEDEDVLQLKRNNANRITVLETILVDVEMKQHECMEKRWKYTKSNGEVIMLRDVFEKIATWVEKFKQIGDVVAQYDATSMSLPWAGIRLLLQVAVNDVQTYGAMAEGIEFISNIVTRCAIIEEIYLQGVSEAKGQLEQAIVKLYTAILQYLLRARKYYDKSTAGRITNALIQTPEMIVESRLHAISKAHTDVNDCMRLVEAEDGEKMKRTLQNIQDRVDKLTTDHQPLDSLLDEIKKPITRIAAQVSELHSNLHESTRERVIQWMSNVPYMNHHRARVKECLPGSGRWFLEDPIFVDWNSSTASSMLWLHGIPGSGKTILVSSIIEHIEKYVKSPVCYFYCTRDVAEPERADPEEILRCILEQLSSTNLDQSVKDPVMDLYKQKKKEAKGRAPEKLGLTESVDLILDLLDDEPAVIVIDALDECDSSLRPDLIAALHTIVQRSASHVKILVSSRHDGDLASYLSEWPKIRIEENDNKIDIDHFVRTKVDQAVKEKRLIKGNVSEQLRDKIIDTLTAGAQGMFRWVSLQIQNLCDPRRIKYEGDVVAELGRLPKTLAESYDITYETIKSSGEASRAVAERTLKWLMCAQRPLKLRELHAAVSVDLDGRYPLPSTDALLDSCCNLMVIDSELQVFRFAHSSVRDYLETREEYNTCETHALALTRCLDLLIVPQGSKVLTPSRVISNDNFRQYAIAYWPMHYRTVELKKPSGSVFEKTLEKARLFMFEDRGAGNLFVQWVSAAKALSQTLHWDDPLKETLNSTFSSPPTPLFLACSFGLITIMDELGGHDGTYWNQRNVNGNTGLHLSAANGHEEVVEMLLDRGADLEAETARTRTALHKAAEHGHRAVVGILLRRGANIAAQDDRGATPLHEASAHGHEAVVALLLENGASCDVTDNRGGTALHVAARHGHACVIQQLVNCGVDVMAKDASEWTALHGASGRGHEAVVRLLLEHEASTSAKDAHGGTPLHWASGHGHESVVHLLLKHGADVSAKDENGDTALHVSAGRGHEPVVKLLLENGADVRSKTVYGGTPLQRAESKHRKTIAKMLRQYCKEHGIPTNEEGMSVSPALLAAHSDHFFCDNCDGTITHSRIYYHCSICDDGDFDLCQDCFDKGIQCYGDGHRLSKLSRGQPVVPTNVEADHEEPKCDSQG